MEIWGGEKKIKQVAEKFMEFRFFTRIHAEKKFIFKTFYACIASHVASMILVATLNIFLVKTKKTTS